MKYMIFTLFVSLLFCQDDGYLDSTKVRNPKIAWKLGLVPGIGQIYNGKYIISGGASQGIKMNDTFHVFEKGDKIKNPQTGMFIELPGQNVGTIRVQFMGGENPLNEFSIVSFVNGGINISNLDPHWSSIGRP